MAPTVNRMFLGICFIALGAGLLLAAWMQRSVVIVQARSPVPGWLASVIVPYHLARPLSQNDTGFESGNIGKVHKHGNQISLHLRSDNDDSWPLFWRQWWYTRVDDLQPSTRYTMTLRGRGHWNYYLPVYSYDNKTWHPFSPREVTQPSKLTLKIQKTFKQKQVWLARYVPYTYSDLLEYLEGLPKKRGHRRKSLGKTPGGRDIPLLEIGARDAKHQIFLHARTHPGEVASSFLLEGFIDEFLSNAKYARAARRQLKLTIVPMLNVDGVVVGNNRITPRGVNLEGKWMSPPGQPFALQRDEVPREVKLLHRAFARALKSGPKPSMALNLHSSNGEPGDMTFFFPHFGHAKRGYSQSEHQLWAKQMTFIDLWRREQGDDWFNPVRPEGGRDFIRKDVPEAWWWRNYKEQVMALSVESTYGMTGDGKAWTSPDELRAMGKTLARSVMAYHGVTGLPK